VSDKPHFIKIRGEAVILNNYRMEEEVVRWLEKEDLMDLMKIFESKYFKEIYSYISNIFREREREGERERGERERERERERLLSFLRARARVCVCV